MKLAINQARAYGASRVVVVVPLMPLEQVKEFKELADHLVYLYAPKELQHLATYFDSFPDVTINDAIECLKTNAED